ncbi:MAG TPA: tetratricopeptide repeat protein [Blastocatellia bacterium]|nr:tetratricopeptide repeat protein [Blastocatellia bacterium]
MRCILVARDELARGRSSTKSNAKGISRLFKGTSSSNGFLERVGVYLSVYSKNAYNSERVSRQLIALAREARLARQTEALENIGEALIGLPLSPDIQRVGRYYLAYCWQARGEIAKGRDALEQTLDRIVPDYRPRAILALGTSYYDAGEFDASAPIYLEAIRAARGVDPLTTCQSLRGLAIIRGISGDHNRALADLSSLLPTMRTFGRLYPADYYDYLNSCAVELGEVGRVEEATRIIDEVLRTPFAKNFPYWLETKLELAAKPRRVFTPFTLALGSPVVLPDCEPCVQIDAQPGPQTTVRTAPLVALSIAPFCIFTPRLNRIAGERGMPARSLAPIPALPGYSVSPPARAPPAYL